MEWAQILAYLKHQLSVRCWLGECRTRPIGCGRRSHLLLQLSHCFGGTVQNKVAIRELSRRRPLDNQFAPVDKFAADASGQQTQLHASLTVCGLSLGAARRYGSQRRTTNGSIDADNKLIWLN